MLTPSLPHYPLQVVRDAPGIALTSAILFIVASVYFIFGWLLNLRGAHGFYTPVWAFATENVTSETLAGGETASKPRTQLMAEPGGNIPSKGATQLAAEPRGVGISGTTAPVGAAHTQVVV